jgi:dihydrofolate reductase
VAKLIYAAITSFDGYVAETDGNFDWAAPDEDVHSFVNDLERDIGTYLYGRRLYDVMRFWETVDIGPDQEAVMVDYATVWRAADKIVFSRTLDAVSTARTRLERRFDPDAVRQLKEQAPSNISVGGAELAAQALAAGLVDECHFFLTPVVVGNGTRSLPDGLRVRLDLLDEHRFDGGVVHLHYRVRGPLAP